MSYYFNTPGKKITKTGSGILDVFTDLRDMKNMYDDAYEKTKETTNSLGIVIKHADGKSAQVKKRRGNFY